MGGTFAKFRMPSSRQSRIDSLRLVMERKRTIVLSFTITILLILTALTVLNTLRSGDSTTVVEELQEEQVSWPEYETWPNWASVSQNTFTVLFPTYKRNDILGRVLHFHCNFALVDRVIVVWNDVDEPTIPENFINYNCSKELFFKRPLVNSVNNRFIPYPEIRTEAVLIIDDDQLPKEKDLEIAFDTWKNSPQLIVGFQSRVHTYDRIFRRYGVTDPRHRYLRTSKENHQYSYIITNVCFVHIHYLHMYTYELPRRFYNFVELHNNCEDIFLAGMVGEFLRKRGRAQPCCIWVEGHGEHLEKVAKDFKGINHSNKQFWPQRAQAMNMMVEEYGHFPLKLTKILVEN